MGTIFLDKMVVQNKTMCLYYFYSMIYLLWLPARASEQGNVIGLVSVYIYRYTVFARSVAAATNVFNLSRREATIQERLLFESGVYLFDCAELNDYVMVFVNV